MTKNNATSDWVNRFGRPATAPTTETGQKAPQSPQKAAQRARKVPAVTEPQGPAPVAPVVSRRRTPAKRAVTYRLTDDVLDLVDAAVNAAAEQGKRLTKEEAVAAAIRRTYNRLTKK